MGTRGGGEGAIRFGDKMATKEEKGKREAKAKARETNKKKKKKKRGKKLREEKRAARRAALGDDEEEIEEDETESKSSRLRFL